MAKPVTVNQNIMDLQYAVRGPIPARAAELAKQGMQTVPCNIGNPQALGQQPISYYREMQSLVLNPSLLERLTDVSEHNMEEARKILEQSKGVGAYTASAGFDFVREAVASFIDKRDNEGQIDFKAADPANIFLTNGASVGADYILQLVINEPEAGIMIPIPQYPLYSATITKQNGSRVDYFPNEEEGWTITRETLEKSYNEAKAKGIDPRLMAIINPGNPTGANMPRESIDVAIDFAEEKGMIILSDEVYQENTYGGKFHSFAKVLGNRDVPLISLHSTSKGFIGECGQRGGYLEIRNAPSVNNSKAGEYLSDLVNKIASVGLCSNTNGQLMTYLMVSPPAEGTDEHAQFIKERDGILSDLEYKAGRFDEAFKEMEGVENFGETGAMYKFPRLNLPAGKNDFDYCMNMLEKTGLVTVNGSGFGLEDHFRAAFLPPKELIEGVLSQMIDTHNEYVKN